MVVFKAALMAFLAVGNAASTPSYLNYTTITGFFQQDDPATVANTFKYVRVSGASERAATLSADLWPLDRDQLRPH